MGLFGRREDEISSGTLEEEASQGFNLSSILTPELQVAIAFGATLLVGFICAMAILPALRPNPPEPTGVKVPSPDFSDPTAREAYVPAVELIRQTDPGAQLTSGAGLWSPNINGTQLTAGRTGWTFFFFLPASSEMARVVVNEGGEARLVDQQPWETPPSILEDQRWQVDSPAAVTKLVEKCGDVLADTPDAGVRARLSMAAEARTILWQMSIRSEGNPLALCEVSVDGITGVAR